MIVVMIQEAPNLITRETPCHFLFLPRAARAARAWPLSDLRQINSFILKVHDGAWSCQIRIFAAEQFPWNLRCLRGMNRPQAFSV
jgi:hypothetical protein